MKNLIKYLNEKNYFNIKNISEKLKLNKQSIPEKGNEYVIFFPYGDDFFPITSNKIFRDTSTRYTQCIMKDYYTIFIITYDNLKESLINAKLNISDEKTRAYLIPDSYDIKELIDDWHSKKITPNNMADKCKDITEEFKHWRDL